MIEKNNVDDDNDDDDDDGEDGGCVVWCGVVWQCLVIDCGNGIWRHCDRGRDGGAVV